MKKITLVLVSLVVILLLGFLSYVAEAKTSRRIKSEEVKVKILFPNGGEVLDRSQIQTIKWSVETVTPYREGVKIFPLWKKASIDLFRRITVTIPCPVGETCKTKEKSVFVKHIATVNLFDQFYSWKITPDIKNSDDYVIRISVGPGVESIWYREKARKPLPLPEEIWLKPRKIVPILRHVSWDESDGTFKIEG
jgi:hypothetical protein